jgi:hypothetical protein
MAIKTKTCDVTGMEFPLSEFYVNKNTRDGLHPYSKYADNYRRTNEFNTKQLRKAFAKFKELTTKNK